MGAVGTSADNSLAEAFNATLKRQPLAGATTWPDALSCRRPVSGGSPATHPPAPLLVRLPDPIADETQTAATLQAAA
jgi:hypothetical protein